MDIGQVIEQYHSACHAFALGDPAPVKAIYARSDDVLLANPFGGSYRGWDAVSQALDFASSNFRDDPSPKTLRHADHRPVESDLRRSPAYPLGQLASQ